MVKGSVSASVDSSKQQEGSKFYLTEPEQQLKNNEQINKNNSASQGSSPVDLNREKEEPLVIPFQSSKQVLELLSQIEEKNLYYIQNTHESEEDLAKQIKVLKELKEKNEAVQKESKERIKVLTNSLNVNKFLLKCSRGFSFFSWRSRRIRNCYR